MEELYTSLYPLMYETAYSIIKDSHTAQDLVHDCVAKLIDKIALLRSFDRKVLVSYVIVSVSNISKNYYNKRHHIQEHVKIGFDDDMAGMVADDKDTPDIIFEAKESYRELGFAIKNLDSKDRELLYLKYNLNMDDQSISEILNIKKNSVREYLTRARRRAKKQLSKVSG